MAEHEHRHPNYRKIYFTLLALLVVSVAGPFLGIGWVTLVTAFGIALVKANMVIQNFMHLKWEKRLVKYVLASSVALLLLFWAGVAADVMKHSGLRWSNDAALAATARGIQPPHHEEEGAAPEHGAEPAPAAAAPAADSAAPAAFDAASAYTATCALCHGATGAGDGPGGAGLDPKPANFTDPAFWSDKTDEELTKAILEGGAAVGKSASMPMWGALYDQAQAEALVAYLKTLRK